LHRNPELMKATKLELPEYSCALISFLAHDPHFSPAFLADHAPEMIMRNELSK